MVEMVFERNCHLLVIIISIDAPDDVFDDWSSVCHIKDIKDILNNALTLN